MCSNCVVRFPHAGYTVVQEPLPTLARAAFTREEVTADVDVAMPDLVHSHGGIASGDESGDEEEVVEDDCNKLIDK